MAAIHAHRRGQAPNYEAETIAHANRVAAAGGTGVDMPMLDAFIRTMKAAGGLSYVTAAWAPGFGHLVSGGSVTRLFSFDPSQRDALPVSSYPSATVTPSGYGGRAELAFAVGVLGINVPLGTTEYTIAALLRTPVVAAGGADQNLLGYGPDSNGYIGMQYKSGKLEAAHVTSYQGTRHSVYYGTTGNYAAQQVRMSDRWLANRTPADVIATGNGTAAGYVQTTVRGPLSSAQQNQLFTIGGMTVYGALTRADSVTISCCILLNTQDPAIAAALDTCIKNQFGMAA